MAYELVEKQRRTGSELKVSITRTGTFIFNAVARKAIEEYLGVDEGRNPAAVFVRIYVDRDTGGNVKIAFRFLRQQEQHCYTLTRHKSAASVSARATLARVGYKHGEHLVRDATWERRSVDGSRRDVLEIELERKYVQD